MGERFDGEDPGKGPRTGGTVSYEQAVELGGEPIHAVLDHPRRRHVLDVVTELDVATMRDLATQVTAREAGIEPHEVSEAKRREVTVSLYHIHVPKLADADVVTVEEGMDRVRPGPNAAAVVDALADVFTEFGSGNERTTTDA